MEWAASLDSCKHVFSFVKVGDSTRLQLEVALKLDSAVYIHDSGVADHHRVLSVWVNDSEVRHTE